MQIAALPTLAPVQTPLGNAPVAGRDEARGGLSPTLDSARGETRPSEVASPVVAGERVSLSAPDAPAPQAVAPAYAEVWKDDVRVAVIDSRGNVLSSSGLLAPLMGLSGGGPEVAARRAAQIARTVGGEIRAAGQVMDVPTLTMRARLQTAYGV